MRFNQRQFNRFNILIHPSLLLSNLIVKIPLPRRKLLGIKVESSMKEAGKIIARKGLGCRLGQMEPSMKAIGLIINPMARENFYTLMEMYMMAVGKMGKLMVMAFLSITWEDDIKATGKMICKMDSGQKAGQMATDTKASIEMERKTVKEITFGMTAVILKETGWIMK